MRRDSGARNDAPFGRMRVAAIAGLVAAVVLSAGFALQAAGLPPAARGALIAAKAAEWLRGYRYAASTLRVGGHTVHGRCFHGWFGGRAVHDERGTILELGNGASVQALGHRRVAVGLPRSLRPGDALDLAGCTDVLGLTLDSLAAAGSVHVRREIMGHRAVLALRFRRLAVVVEPVTYRPLGVEVAGIRSRIRLVRLTPALEHRLEALG